MTNAVLIAGNISEAAIAVLERDKIAYEQVGDLLPEELADMLGTGKYQVLIIRSGTKVTEPIIFEKAKGLKLVVRAGSGVDNIDVNLCSRHGIVVENTPGGNAQATAEHAIALMFDAARHVSVVSPAMHNGVWMKDELEGFELFGKTLGIIGRGKVGAIVEDLAKGLKMNVLVYEPNLTDEKAAELGVNKVGLKELLNNSDIITLHASLSQEARNIINQKTIEEMKDGVCLINCARGEMLDDEAVIKALKSGKIAFAAIDVHKKEFNKKKPHDWKYNPYRGIEKVTLTPHRSAATREAQRNVAVASAEQASLYNRTGEIIHAVNMPFVPPEARPYMLLGYNMGLMASQIIDGKILKVAIGYGGKVSTLKDTDPVRNSILEGLFKPIDEEVNVMSSHIIAQDNGVEMTKTRYTNGLEYKTLLSIDVTTDGQGIKLAGSLFSGRPWLVEIDGVAMKEPLQGDMLYVCHTDEIGMFALVAGTISKARVNMKSFHGETPGGGGDNIILAKTDATFPLELVREIGQLQTGENMKVHRACLVSFEKPFNGSKGTTHHM